MPDIFLYQFCPLAFAQGLPRAAPEDVGLDPERLERLSAKMRAYVDGGQLAGTITAVVRHGKLAHFETAGSMDVEAGKPMRGDAIFRIQSMTKPVTGVAMMILYEEGRYLLTDPVAKYLPELADSPFADITVRNILDMASGIDCGTMSSGAWQIRRSRGVP